MHTGNVLSAMHTSLTPTGPCEFPLHADLYPPQLLLNIYDDVRPGTGGASTFLRQSRLYRLLAECGVPERLRTLIRAVLRGIPDHDLFTLAFSLLHDEHGQPWSRALQDALARHRYMITLTRGQGYLLDDRQWLHGRDRISVPVKRSRLHRLIFDSNFTAARRPVPYDGKTGRTRLA
jgi:hypothetical protein